MKPKFCSDGCKDGFRTDRRLGLIYGPFMLDGKLVSWEEGTAKSGECAYCRTQTEGK